MTSVPVDDPQVRVPTGLQALPGAVPRTAACASVSPDPARYRAAGHHLPDRPADLARRREPYRLRLSRYRGDLGARRGIALQPLLQPWSQRHGPVLAGALLAWPRYGRLLSGGHRRRSGRLPDGLQRHVPPGLGAADPDPPPGQPAGVAADRPAAVPRRGPVRDLRDLHHQHLADRPQYGIRPRRNPQGLQERGRRPPAQRSRWSTTGCCPPACPTC